MNTGMIYTTFGKITYYNKLSRKGWVSICGKKHPFDLYVWQGGLPQRNPNIKETVEIVFQDDRLLRIRAL